MGNIQKQLQPARLVLVAAFLFHDIEKFVGGSVILKVLERHADRLVLAAFLLHEEIGGEGVRGDVGKLGEKFLGKTHVLYWKVLATLTLPRCILPVHGIKLTYLGNRAEDPAGSKEYQGPARPAQSQVQRYVRGKMELG